MDQIKIDRVFISALESEDTRAHRLLLALIRLAKRLRIRWSRKVWRTRASCARAGADGVRPVQGYYLSRPLSVAGFTELLARQRWQLAGPWIGTAPAFRAVTLRIVVATAAGRLGARMQVRAGADAMVEELLPLHIGGVGGEHRREPGAQQVRDIIASAQPHVLPQMSSAEAAGCQRMGGPAHRHAVAAGLRPSHSMSTGSANSQGSAAASTFGASGTQPAAAAPGKYRSSKTRNSWLGRPSHCTNAGRRPLAALSSTPASARATRSPGWAAKASRISSERFMGYGRQERRERCGGPGRRTAHRSKYIEVYNEGQNPVQGADTPMPRRRSPGRRNLA